VNLLLIPISKGGQRVLRYYAGSHIKALIDIYPELMMKPDSFFQFKRLYIFATFRCSHSLFRNERADSTKKIL
jgi:hypothetical protein